MDQRYKNYQIETNPNLNHPLIRLMKNSYEKKLKAEKEKEMEEKCEILAIQTKGVNIVKDHILKRKKEFLCHQSERAHIKQIKKKELEENILNKYKINLQNTETRNKIANQLLNYDKSEKMKMNTQKQRMKNIVQKLLTELEYKDKVTPPKRKITKKKLQTIDDLTDFNEFEFEEEIEDKTEIEDWEDVEIVKLTPKPSKKLKKTESKISKKSSKKNVSSEKELKQTPNPNEYCMPFVPILNKRYKIKKDELSKMSSVIPPCKAINMYLDDLKEFMDEIELCPIDSHFSSKPEMLIFEEFENGQCYTQKLHIYNFSCDTAICSFERLVSNNEFCNIFIEVENVGIQKIYPGRSYTLKIYFRPRDMTCLEGKFIFLTRKVHDSELKRFEVQVRCTIATIKLCIKPSTLFFKSLPIWKMKKSVNSKDRGRTIEVHNDMIYDCKLVIRKKAEPFMTGEISNTESRNDTKSMISRKSRKSQFKKSSLSMNKDSRSSNIYANFLRTYMTYILESCLDYIDHIFTFDTYFINVPSKSSICLEVLFKELPHIGCFSENYEFDFFSSFEKTLLTETVFIEIEITGKFIVPERDYIDFNTCVYNFVYQQAVKIFNNGTSRLKIGFLFPSKVKQYFSIYPATFFMKPASNETINIRFMPRIDLKEKKSKYFDKFTGILNFPVKVCILAPRDIDVPPSIISIFSILTESDDLNIRFVDRDCTFFNNNGEPILHLGSITTHETVTADLEIENLSAVNQNFGFLNLPEAFAIEPNYGFGTLDPNEIKYLKIHYSPTIYDMITSQKLHTYEPIEVSFKLTCTTTYKLGEIKEKQVLSKKPSQFKDTFSEQSAISSPKLPTFYDVETEDDLFEYHEYMFEQEELEQLYNNEVDIVDGAEEPVEEEEEEEEEIKIMKNLTIIVKAIIVDYWTEISHQNIIFPDTPLGSYSTMKFHFSAVNHSSAFSDCVCGFINKSKLPNFECHFEIYGGTDGISIEPICGNLKKNERKQIYLIAKPTPDEKLVYNQAHLLKLKRGNVHSHNKDRVSSSKSIKYIYDESDLYLAEKEVWKSIKPYNIIANYIIVINFPNESYKADEYLYLTVQCRVIKPQFITSLNSQFINFGYIPLQTRPKKIITIQNVSRHAIYPEIGLISPVGSYICATQLKLKLEKEFLLKVPVTFYPIEEKVYNEYFEIKSGNTIETIKISGEGIKAVFNIVPEFNVFRVKSKGGKTEDCIIHFDNKCKAPISLKIIKACELQGKIVEDPNVIKEVPLRPTSDITNVKSKNTKKEKKSSSKSAKTSSKNTEKNKKMSLELNPDEKYSFENHFATYTGLSPFSILDLKNDTKIVEPYNKSSIKIRFGPPKIVVVDTKSSDSAKKSKKNSPSNEKKGKGKKEKTTTVHLDKNYKYVAKYNIMMGDIVLIKDLIIIGEFQ